MPAAVLLLGYRIAQRRTNTWELHADEAMRSGLETGCLASNGSKRAVLWSFRGCQLPLPARVSRSYVLLDVLGRVCVDMDICHDGLMMKRERLGRERAEGTAEDEKKKKRKKNLCSHRWLSGHAEREIRPRRYTQYGSL